LIRSPDIERAAVLLLACASAVVAVTCSGNGSLHAEAPARTAAGVTLPSARPAAPSASVSSGPASPPGFQLPHLYAALRQLSSGAAQAPVRILWLGDSHSYPDFWTNAVRRPLQKRFGNGGPGFVLLGMDPYRHAGVKVARQGHWRHDPPNPATALHHSDGVFGLGGIRMVPVSRDARASVELEPGAVAGRAHWTLYYRLPDPGAHFTVAVTGSSPVRVDADTGTPRPAGSPLRQLALDSPPTGKLELSAPSGKPQLFGVTIESASPGVVVDTLGINGARAATTLAWEKAAWEAEVKEQKPALVVLAYGTNEVAHPLAIAKNRQYFDRLLARVHAAQPQADCLLAGPTDWDDNSGRTRPRVLRMDQLERQIASAHGCAYFSVYDAMGGQGSHRRWEHASPQLGAVDHIHLMPAGYRRVGKAMVKELLGGYAASAGGGQP